MEKKTKTILKVIAAVAVVVIGYNMLSKKEDEATSGFLGFSFKKKKKNNNPTNTVTGGAAPKCTTTCEYTNKFNGAVTTYANACKPALANNGYKTIVRCTGGGSNTALSGAQ